VGLLFVKALNCSFYITVETRVYTQSSVFRSEGFLGQGFCCEGLGYFLLCVFIPVAFGLGGKKVPSIFGIEIHT
jgi:hypothetical protein